MLDALESLAVHRMCTNLCEMVRRDVAVGTTCADLNSSRRVSEYDYRIGFAVPHVSVNEGGYIERFDRHTSSLRLYEKLEDLFRRRTAETPTERLRLSDGCKKNLIVCTDPLANPNRHTSPRCDTFSCLTLCFTCGRKFESCCATRARKAKRMKYLSERRNSSQFTYHLFVSLITHTNDNQK